MADFLLEIGTEEIPDWMIEPALEELRSRFQSDFAAFGGSALEMEGTPRRLVLLAKDLLGDESPRIVVEFLSHGRALWHRRVQCADRGEC